MTGLELKVSASQRSWKWHHTDALWALWFWVKTVCKRTLLPNVFIFLDVSLIYEVLLMVLRAPCMRWFKHCFTCSLLFRTVRKKEKTYIFPGVRFFCCVVLLHRNILPEKRKKFLLEKKSLGEIKSVMNVPPKLFWNRKLFCSWCLLPCLPPPAPHLTPIWQSYPTAHP